MTEEQNKILWDKLRGVTEHKHKEIFKSKNNDFYCVKCNTFRNKADRNKSCPIPDPYPGTPADIAKEIRVFMAKQDWKTTSSYYNNIHVMFVNTDHDCSFASWLIFGITDEQKIEAFTNLWKKDKKCQQ